MALATMLAHVGVMAPFASELCNDFYPVYAVHTSFSPTLPASPRKLEVCGTESVLLALRPSGRGDSAYAWRKPSL
jgi:hypothetical protein